MGDKVIWSVSSDRALFQLLAACALGRCRHLRALQVMQTSVLRYTTSRQFWSLGHRHACWCCHAVYAAEP